MDTHPVQVRAGPEPTSGRGLWLVKWLLLIPHYVVLVVLWTAFVVLTVVAYLAILFTGRYPARIHAFNTGVLRWSWRVNYYAYNVLGTDRYPPFTLAEVPGYPAGLTIRHPQRVRRWLPLVAWLLAVPHVLIVGALYGSGGQFDDGEMVRGAPGVAAVLVLVVAVALLFTGRYPRGLYDLLLGVSRWTVRTVAYVALLTDRYPPFRLDMGPAEPVTGGGGPAGAVPPLGAQPPSGTGRPTVVAAPAAAGAPAATGAGQPVTASPGGGRVGRWVALIAGVLLLGGAVTTGVVGGGLLWLDNERDADGYVTSPTFEVSTATAAVTAEHLDLRIDRPVAGLDDGGFGDVRLEATGVGATPLFLGVARQSDVDAWLAGTAHENLTDAYGDGPVDRTRRVDGQVRPVPFPQDQGFWLARASGTGPVTLTWEATTGEFAFVLARMDGGFGVVADVRAGTTVPDTSSAGGGLLGAGVVLLLLSVLLIVLGAAGLGPRPPGAPSASGPQPSAPSGPPSEGPPPGGTGPAGSTSGGGGRGGVLTKNR